MVFKCYDLLNLKFLLLKATVFDENPF